MSSNGHRIAMLNAVLAIVVGALMAGFLLTCIVARDVYHQIPIINPPGDYRAWRMAHLEGLLNGLLMIGLASAVQGQALTLQVERWFVGALILSTWGNTFTSILAPLVRVRGMAFGGGVVNDVVAGLFAVALLGTLTAFFIAVRALLARA